MTTKNKRRQVSKTYRQRSTESLKVARDRAEGLKRAENNLKQKVAAEKKRLAKLGFECSENLTNLQASLDSVSKELVSLNNVYDYKHKRFEAM